MDPLTRSLATHEALKRQLREIYGDEIDQEALLDTLDGESDLVELIAATYRQALADDAMVEGIKALQDKLAARRKRIEHRSEKLKAAVAHAMEASERAKITAPDFTLSLGRGPDKLIVTDDGLIPPDFWRIKREPDKAALKEALKGGATIPGAVLSNGGTVLRARTI